MIDRDELAAWLQLLETAGVGRDGARRLLATYGSPQAVLAAKVLAAPPDTFPALLKTMKPLDEDFPEIDDPVPALEPYGSRARLLPSAAGEGRVRGW